MATPGLAFDGTDENEVLKRFVELAALGLKKEDEQLAAAGSKIHRKARGIWFADYEVVHAYLIRRALAEYGFGCDIEYEYRYRSCGNLCDLVIFPSGTPRTLAVEMAWVTDDGERNKKVLSDAAKLAAERSFDRKFVFLFPLAVWDGPTVGPIAVEPYLSRLMMQSHYYGHFSLRLQQLNDGFETQFNKPAEPSLDLQVPFRLALIEVLPQTVQAQDILAQR